MSNIYIQEPPTSGKVLLKTTVGDIDIELWSKECPMACRNFIQLCLEGFYNGTIFHRVVKGFIVQGGDRNGDGTGGESAFGHQFKDEFHSRLRYVRRGLVGMANSGKNDNGSQFFFTLGATPELQNQNTLFGKVTGDTIYNMLKLEDGEIYENERPHFTHRVVKAVVLNNPFDDIIPRRLEVDAVAQRIPAVESTRKTKKGIKNVGLLSFGDEAEVEELETNVFVQNSLEGRGKSSHDVLDDPRLSKQTMNSSDPAGNKGNALPEPQGNSSDTSEDRTSRQHIDESRMERLKHTQNKLKRKTEQKHEKEKVVEESDGDSDYGLESGKKKAKHEQAEKIRKEIKQLKRDYRSDKRSQEEEKKVEQSNTAKKSFIKEVHDVQEKYAQKNKHLPKKGSSRENFTMELLQKFKTKLQSAHDRDPDDAAESKNPGNEEEDIQGDNWLSHKLEFEKKDPILAKDAATKDDHWYDVYDPRNPLNKRKRGEKKDGSKKPSN